MVKLFKNKRNIGLILGIIIGIGIWNMNISNIPPEGQKTMALSLMTVVFWATGVGNMGFVSIFYLVSLVLFNIAPPSQVFSLWATPTIYLIIGAYLMADAVNKSGLGERIAYKFVIKFVSFFKSIIISSFVLQVILSLLIPHPWPRAFIILSVMKIVIESANIPKEDGRIIGFSVFAAAVPTSMFFLTGDSNLNILVVDFAGQNFGWIDWVYHMGIPSLFSSALTCILLLMIFKPSSPVTINKEAIQEKLDSLGKLTSLEKRTIFWISIAIVLWMTDFIHNIALGWITILIAILMSMPIIGGVLDDKSWKAVPLDTLFFLTGALSIGKIGEITGMNSWIVSSILPASAPDNIYLFALLVVLVSKGLHMVLGSAITVMSIVTPTFLEYTSSLSMNPLVPALLVYTSVASHYILPHQQITMVVGMGEDHGMYDSSDVIKLGIPLTLVVFMTVLLVQIPWWHITGLL